MSEMTYERMQDKCSPTLLLPRTGICNHFRDWLSSLAVETPMIATKIGICFCIQGEPGLNGVKGLKGEPGQKGDRGPLGLPVSKENFPFQCKSQTLLSTLSNNSGLLGGDLTFEISVIGKHMLLEQSSAQFCLMPALVSEEDPMTNDAVSVLSFNYIHANLPL